MAWIEPKTDWTSSDYFNAEDYNRIIGNVIYLKAFSDALFNALTNVSLGEEKNEISLIYAREMNNIESSIDKLNFETYRLDLGEAKEYLPNTRTPNFEDLNRLESATLLLYNTMVAHKNALPRLAFTLGGQKGIRV